MKIEYELTVGGFRRIYRAKTIAMRDGHAVAKERGLDRFKIARVVDNRVDGGVLTELGASFYRA